MKCSAIGQSSEQQQFLDRCMLCSSLQKGASVGGGDVSSVEELSGGGRFSFLVNAVQAVC